MTHPSINAASTHSKRTITLSWEQFRSRLRQTLSPVQDRMNGFEIRNRRVAHLICRTIPSQCPFERDLGVLGYTVHVPPLCKLNPLFEELMDLRFRALTYLAEQCNEDITAYIT